MGGTSATFSSALTFANGGANYLYGGALRVLYSNGTNTNNIYSGGVNGLRVINQADTTALMTVTDSGNLGLGVTPSAWASGIARIALQVGVVSVSTNVGNDAFWGTNYYDDGTNNRYINSDFSLIYAQQSGSHIWYNAPSGTAGAAITFTQAMTLTAAGNLLVGTTTDAGYKLDVNGTGRFSNELRIDGAGIKLFVNGSDSLGGFFYQQSITGTTYANNMQMGASGDNQFWNYTTGGGWVKQLSIATTGAATFETTSSANAIFNSTNASGGFIAFRRSGTNIGYLGNSAQLGIGTLNALELRADNNLFLTTTSGTLSILSTGNVGIGTASPNVILEVGGLVADVTKTVFRSSLAVAPTAYYNDITAIYSGASAQANKLQINYANGYTSGTGIVLQGDGNVGIGTDSPSEKLTVYGAVIRLEGAAGVSPFAIANNNSSGFRIYDYNAGVDRMTITTGGALCLGVTSAYGTNLLNVNGGIYATSSIAAVVAADIDMFVFSNTGASYSKSCIVASMVATGGTGSYFFYGQQSTSTVALKIFSNGNIQNTNNSYGAISDARLKENIIDATPKLDDLMKVKVRNYNLKGESNKQLGVISQELEAIFPNMIEESTNIGSDVKIKGVKYSVFVPMLIKAVQELKAEIEILKNK